MVVQTSTSTTQSNSNFSSQIIRSVCISVLIDLLGFTVILPLFPSLLEFYKKNDQGKLYALLETTVSSFRNMIGVPESENINSVLFGGMIGSIFSLLQFFNSPLFGAASDRFGRKPLILISLFGSSISYALWGISKSFGLFLIARIIGGISEANVSISTALIADLPNASDRSKGMAAIGISFSLGFVFGPILGAWFTNLFSNQPYFYVGPAAFSFAITLIDILYVWKNLPETLPQKKRASSIADSVHELSLLLNPISLFSFSAVKSVQGKKKGSLLRTVGIVYFMYLFLFSGLEFTLTFLVHRRFSFTRMDQGKMFGLLGVTMALIQGGYIRRKMNGREKSLAQLGMVLLIPGFVIIGFSSVLSVFAVGLFFFAYAASSVVPCLSSIASGIGDESEKGKVMGILRSLGALARATGPLVASSCYWLFGASVTYIVGGLFLIIPLMILRTANVQSAVTKKD